MPDLRPFNGAVLNIETDGRRTRKVVRRSNARSTSKIVSRKVGRMIQCESFAEKCCFKFLEQGASVASYCEQPCEITYILEPNGAELKHTPDVLVRFNDGRANELWEVKSEKDEWTPQLVERTLLLMRALPMWGYNYRLIRVDKNRVPFPVDMQQLLGGSHGRD